MAKSNTAEVINLNDKKAEMTDDFLDALDNTTVEKKTATKSKSSVEVKSTKEVKKAVDDYNKGKKMSKEGEALMKSAGPVVINFVKIIQDKDGYKSDFRKSYDVPGGDSKVKYVSSNRYSIKTDDETMITEILGDNFSKLIEKTRTVTMKSSVLKDPVLQKLFLDKLGKENFAKFFETVTSLSPVEDFDKKIYNVLDTDELQDLRTFMKPYKPSLR